mmetsp:Transcript_102225/g.329820  ORF Transcript_102225/g.329820 Transcript_102225/m.329820 type:complete len:270 (+) Transcript_102225:467-1276(+)
MLGLQGLEADSCHVGAEAWTIGLRTVHGLYGVRERHSVTHRIDTLDRTATKLTVTLGGRPCEEHWRAVGGIADVEAALPALHAAVLEPPCVEVAVVRSLPTVARLAKLAFELLCTKGHESRLQVAVHSNGASEFPKANTTATVRFLSLPTGIPVHVFCAGLDVGVGVGEGGANEGKLEGRIWWRIKDVISIGSAAQNWQPLPLVLARLGASATGTIRATTASRRPIRRLPSHFRHRKEPRLRWGVTCFGTSETADPRWSCRAGAGHGGE